MRKQSWSVLCYLILYHTVAYCTVLCYTILSCPILSNTMLCYAILRQTRLDHTKLCPPGLGPQVPFRGGLGGQVNRVSVLHHPQRLIGRLTTARMLLKISRSLTEHFPTPLDRDAKSNTVCGKLLGPMPATER